jgi:small-conductance mechanosensitive channel
MAERNTSTERRARTQPGARKKPSVKRPAVKRVATAARRRGVKAAPTLPRSRIRALKQALAKAEAEVASVLVARDRAVNRVTRRAQREREALEAQLIKLVQEIGQLRHHAERVQRLETESRQKDGLLAERSREWAAERAALQAEVERLQAKQEQPRSGRSERNAADAPTEAFARPSTIKRPSPEDVACGVK